MNPTERIRAWIRRKPNQLLLVLAAAVLVRLVWLASRPVMDTYDGGDGPWYVYQGWQIARGELSQPLSTVGPLYPFLLAFVWLFFPGGSGYPNGLPPAAYLTAVRILQIGLSLGLVWLGYRLVRDLTGNHAAAMFTAAGLALGPAFMIGSFSILTEPLFMTLLTLSGWLYVRAQADRRAAAFGPAGLALAFAALTRPIALLLPVVLLPHLLARFGWSAGRGRMAWFVLAFAAAVVPWLVYLDRTTGQPFPQGLASNLWIGAVGEGHWEGPAITDERRQELGDDDRSYTREAIRVIAEDPLGWIALRTKNVLSAVGTPHGTSDLGGPSVKAMLLQWLHSDGSVQGLWALMKARYFPLKSAVYAFHYVAVLLAAVGTWVSRHRWRDFHFVFAVIVYLVFAHAALTILPRYLFPAEPFLWVLAGVGASRFRVPALRPLRSSGS